MNIKRMKMVVMSVLVTSSLGLGFDSFGASSQAVAAGTGGTLNVGFTVGIPQLNPAVATFNVEWTLFPLLWDGLTQYSSKGTVSPDLATSWSASNNNKTWTFQLRSGVTFSNGVAVTSADVVNSFNYYLNPTTPFQDNTGLGIVTSVTASGPSSVVIQLSTPDSWLPEAVIPVKVIDMAALSTIDTNPIGTGPFVVQSFVPNSTLTLVRNPTYWGTSPSVSQINIVAEPDPTAAFTALTAGTIQVMGDLPNSDLSRVKSLSSLKVIQPSISGIYLDWEVDTTKGVFKNVKARQALAYAINRKAVLGEAYFGAGTVSNENDPIAVTSSWYDSHLTKYTYNLSTAKKLFAEAGIHAGSKLTWWSDSAYPEWTTAGEILQASLAKIGIKLKIVNSDTSTWVAKFYPPGKSFPGLIVPNYQSRLAAPVFSMEAFTTGVCECNWTSKTYDSLYSKAVGSTNKAIEIANWNKLQTLLNKAVPVEIPGQISNDEASSSSVSGIWEEGGDLLHLENAVIKNNG
jgi:peptide/nickel transport system substrate-binding protein